MWIEVSDDSGFLAVVDPDAYSAFVAEDWELGDLVSHFKSQMSSHHLLLWGTGRQDFWSLEVHSKPSSVAGYREVGGGIVCTNGRLLLTNFESLSMAAQFEDADLLQDQESDQVLELDPGPYACRIVQLHDPEDESEPAGPGFVLELARAAELPASWSEIPWSEDL